MITLTQLNNFLTNFINYDQKINPRKVDEHNGNGLQIEGSEHIEKIGFGVTASVKLFELAHKKGCQALVVHHGIRMPETPHFDKAFQKRIGFLIKNNLSLFGYHFLLDSHPEIGHNALILKSLGISKKEKYEIMGENWGWYGKFATTKSLQSVIRQCEKLFKKNLLVYNFGKKEVKTVAAISGGGAPKGVDLQNVVDRNIDLFITGEASESTRELFREIETNFIAGGHYATETFGVKALMKKVGNTFKGKIDTEFLDIWNDV